MKVKILEKKFSTFSQIKKINKESFVIFLMLPLSKNFTFLNEARQVLEEVLILISLCILIIKKNFDF